MRQRLQHQPSTRPANCVARRLSDTKHRLSREFARRTFSVSIPVWRWGTESGDSSALTRGRHPARKRWGTGGGVRAATIRTAPRPQALGNHRTRTRIVSMVWLVSGALWSLLEMLSHDQPRDSHVHGAPHARAEPSAQLMQHERGVCARRTATKYRNTTTATRHPAGLPAARACSVANMVAIAGSSR